MDADKFSELLDGDRVDVYVGPRRQRWNLPEKLLCHHSSFFTKAFTGNFQEGIEKSLELEEDDVASFKLLVQWMFRNTLDKPEQVHGWGATDGAELLRLKPGFEPEPSNEDPISVDDRSIIDIDRAKQSHFPKDIACLFERANRVVWVYVKLYVLADKLGMGSLQDQTIDLLRDGIVNIFPPRLVLWIYQNTVPSSPLRRCAASSVSSGLLLIDLVPTDYGHLITSCQDIATDLIEALVREAQEVVYTRQPFRDGLCALHVHERGAACPQGRSLELSQPRGIFSLGTDIWIFPAAKPVSYEEEHDIPSLTNRLRCELARVWDDISTRCSRSARDLRTLRQVRLTLIRDLAKVVDQSAS